MKFTEYPSAADLMAGLAASVAGELAALLDAAPRVSLCVPGGSTPAPFFDHLSTLDLAWDRVDVLLTDERWVPEDSPRSNTRMIKDRLLQNNASAAHLIPFFQPGLDPVPGAAQGAAALQSHLPLGVLVLGMGADMHCASLFPGAPELAQAQSDNGFLKKATSVIVGMNQ